MNRFRLSKVEKVLFIRISQGDHRNFGLDKYVYLDAMLSLHSHGLISLKQEYNEVVDARTTILGRSYIINNPKLKNPIDWRFIVSTAIQSIIATTLALFIACSK